MNLFVRILLLLMVSILCVGTTACRKKTESHIITDDIYVPPNYAVSEKNDYEDVKSMLIENRWTVVRDNGIFKYNFDDTLVTEYGIKNNGNNSIQYYGYQITDDTVTLRLSEEPTAVFHYSVENGKLLLYSSDKQDEPVNCAKKNYTTAEFGEDTSGITDILYDYYWSARFKDSVAVSYEFDSNICTQHLHYNNYEKTKKSIQMLYRIEKDAIILLTDKFEEIVLPYSYSDGTLTLVSQYGPNTKLSRRHDVLTINDSIDKSFIYDSIPIS